MAKALKRDKTRQPLAEEIDRILQSFGIARASYTSGDCPVHSPLTGEAIAHVSETSADDAMAAIAEAHDAFLAWRAVPAPRRGEFVRLLGEELRAAKSQLGRLVTIEVGKIVSEGLGEVQEMIDICDFAVGLSRQLYGLTMGSERTGHRLMEQWHPIGPVGVISAFNFPVAVWSWNAALALVCGNSIVWKPSEKTPLTAIAVSALFERVATKFEGAPKGLAKLLLGGRDLGKLLVDDARVPVISATGSTAMGRIVGECVAKRFGRSILELGGNNAAIVCPSADVALAVRAIAFSAMGTAGQRCTSLRRLIVHASIYDRLVPRLKQVYASVAVDNPVESDALVGPLIGQAAFAAMQSALAAAAAAGGVIHGGERQLRDRFPSAFYVRPALVEMPDQVGPMIEETFAPILYVLKYTDFDQALRFQNGVPQGLSSSIFTTDLREADQFLSAAGSDCGIANVNAGPSGAEIGGAFGGQKETGGGREAGADSWKGYMRRMTSTVNFGRTLPLAQGVKFEIDENIRRVMNTVAPTAAGFRPAQRLAAVGVSEILAITAEASALKRAGRPMIILGAGEPDFDTPDRVKEAAARATRAGATKYTALDGSAELKAAVRDKFRRENRLEYGLDEITCGAGAKQILFNAFMATLDPGDEVIIPAPYWTTYADIVVICGGTPVTIPCSEDNGFRLQPDQLARAITPRTRWLLLNSPANPSGTAYRQDDLKALAEALHRHPHVWVMSDDIYEHIIYDGFRFATIAEVDPGLRKRALTINGVSKAYAMTGWRIGYAGGPKSLIGAMAVVQSQSTSCPSSVSQVAAIEALNGPQEVLQERAASFCRRRDIVVDALNAIPGLRCRRPIGAFYAFASCEGFMGKTAPDGRVLATDGHFCRYLMEAADVAVVPGSCFGLAPYFRISYAASEADLIEASRRIAIACRSLN